MDWDRLIAAATAARAHAYAPYSRYDVGAALLMEDGSVFAAANVENCLPALGTCAERNAMCAALSAGKHKPVAVAVVTASSPPAYPCGLCRQTLREFADDGLKILVTNPQGEREETTLGELLPHGFQLKEWGGENKIGDR
jgi:cytidine deaminase